MKHLEASAELRSAVDATVKLWAETGRLARLWRHDGTLWTGSSEGSWLGWLRIVAAQLATLDRLESFAEHVRTTGFRHAILLGMGGSSLGPEVLRRTLGVRAGFPDLVVLDSTDPAEVSRRFAALDLASTLVIVSSKSGTTLEPRILLEHALVGLAAAVGDEEARRRVVVITDPDSPLARDADERGFAATFYGDPAIGGRYSVLSDFGMVPAAVMGLDVRGILDRAETMVEACSPASPAESNPGVLLGALLGESARRGRDKITFSMSPGLAALGSWLEQLLAESTGKQGKGLIPIDGEPLGAPEVYGSDRVFVRVRLAGEEDDGAGAALARLAAAGHPVAEIVVEEREAIGGEFFRWEMATAVAASILGINAFDQPDVEASKEAARRITAAYEATGALPAQAPAATDGGLEVYGERSYLEGLEAEATVLALLRAHLLGARPGDYVGLLAYIERDGEHEAVLQAIRAVIRDRLHVATAVGFGPRFQHSTGQAYKGGPNTGVFLQITAEPSRDVPVPGASYSFGVVEAAQARGDFQAMAAKDRRILRVDLGRDLEGGLARLRGLVDAALGLAHP